MDKTELAELALESLASEYGVDLSGYDSFSDKRDQMEAFVESTEELERTDEVELELTISIPISEDVEGLLWDGWWEYTRNDLTRNIADDGIERSGKIKDIEFKHIW